MKGYDLKNNILNPNRLKDKNSKNRENASSSSKKNRLSPDVGYTNILYQLIFVYFIFY